MTLVQNFVRICVVGLLLSGCKSPNDASDQKDVGLANPISNQTAVVFLDNQSANIQGWLCKPSVVKPLNRTTCIRDGQIRSTSWDNFAKLLSDFNQLGPYHITEEDLTIIKAYLAQPGLSAKDRAILSYHQRMIQDLLVFKKQLTAGNDVLFLSNNPMLPMLANALGLKIEGTIDTGAPLYDAAIQEWILHKHRIRSEAIYKDGFTIDAQGKSLYTAGLYRNGVHCMFVSPGNVRPTDLTFDYSGFMRATAGGSVDASYSDANVLMLGQQSDALFPAAACMRIPIGALPSLEGLNNLFE